MNEKNTSITRVARLAGFLFLWLIITGLTGMITVTSIRGSGTFADKARNIAASEHAYRIALCFELVETMSAALLAFALYTVLKSVNQLVAQFAMYWRLGESFIGGVSVVFGFATLNAYLSSASIADSHADDFSSIVEFTGGAGYAFYNISATFFGIGSILFFYLFYKSRSIPLFLSITGLVASVIVPIICIGSLVFPEYHENLQWGWIPMAIAEIGTGIWLMVYGGRVNTILRRA